MLRSQCFYGDFGALGFRKTAFHGPAVAFFQNTLLPSRQQEKPTGETSLRSRRSVKLTTAKNHSKHCSRRPSSAGGKMAADYKSAAIKNQLQLKISCNVEAAPPEGHIIHKQALFTCEGCLWPQAAESAELHIRLTEVSGTGVGIYELRHLWACAAGSSAKGSPRARQTRELRPEILQRAGANRGGVGLPAV